MSDVGSRRAVRRSPTGLLAALLLAAFTLPAQASISVDINAVTNTTTTDLDSDPAPATAVTVDLPAGVWRVDPISLALGGAYTAWNAWGGAVVGCDAGGANCRQGWMHWYRIQSPEVPRMRVEDGVLYATPDLAYANAAATQFTLTTPQTVSFFIFDTAPSGNLGGVSLRLTDIPEPASAGLVAFALGVLGLARGRRRGRCGDR